MTKAYVSAEIGDSAAVWKLASERGPDANNERCPQLDKRIGTTLAAIGVPVLILQKSNKDLNHETRSV